MKKIPSSLLLAFCAYSGPSHSFLYYVIVDPAKSGQKVQQMGQDNMTFLERKLDHMQGMAKDMGTYIADFELQGNLSSFQTATMSAGGSEPHNLQTQASMEPAVGLCELVSYSINDFVGDHGCAFYLSDNSNASIVYKSNMLSPSEIETNLFERNIDQLKHRNPSVNSESVHTEMTLLQHDVLGSAQLTEISQEDREAMDQYVDLVMGANQIAIDPVDQNSSPQAKRLFNAQLKDHLWNDFLRSSAKSTYVHRSRVGDGMSPQSDIWFMRDNQVNSMKALSMPIMTGAGLAQRPTIESEIRNDAINRARLAKLLLAMLESSLQKEATLAARTEVLEEVLANGK